MIINVAFSKNYDNNQRCNIQSVYFGHQCFTLFTSAFYMNQSVATENVKIDAEANLIELPVVIVSSETSHDPNITFCNNNILMT